jgi:hypothetical protein
MFSLLNTFRRFMSGFKPFLASCCSPVVIVLTDGAHWSDQCECQNLCDVVHRSDRC